MVIYYFSHLLINEQVYTDPEVTIPVTQDLFVEAFYETADVEHLHANVGPFAVYSSTTLGDFFILNTQLDEIVARLPTLQDALDWITNNTPQAAGSGIIIGILALLWLRSRK